MQQNFSEMNLEPQNYDNFIPVPNLNQVYQYPQREKLPNPIVNYNAVNQTPEYFVPEQVIPNNIPSRPEPPIPQIKPINNTNPPQNINNVGTKQLLIKKQVFAPQPETSNTQNHQPPATKQRKKSQMIYQKDSKDYEIDLKNINPNKTTLMIRNIPNKYTQDLMLERVDRHFVKQYDFFYLPIDFKNKCNVGYAFINFLNINSIPPFYEEFNNTKWERFNSEKICSINYARIQGKDALLKHFQNSSVMNQVDAKLKHIFDFFTLN